MSSPSPPPSSTGVDQAAAEAPPPSSPSREISSAGFTFFSAFDSGNLGRVEQVIPEHRNEDDNTASLEEAGEPLPPPPLPSPSGSGGRRSNPESVNPGSPSDPTDFHFNMWTRPDCAGTEFENGNRTWFYFGIKDGPDPIQPYTLKFTFR